MKRQTMISCALQAALGLLVISAANVASAEECKTPPAVHSKELDRVKSLEGRWHGTTMMDGKPGDVDVTYHVTSGGSAVVETLMPGTPHEMVSVYHDDHGKLTMAHYCLMGNQPELDLSENSPSSLELTFGKGNSINPTTEGHMHSLRLSFIDEDHIVQTWGNMQNGKAGEPAVFKLSRVKEGA